ncbi:hypothetical protein [Pseudonocardia parietis]|uniref:HipA-like C-terminal domain-containing protein n=1 Tax=Pseudonocardia parietis TaxID=570936 RepID=A0ABS4VL60_9PSEU|nr:hypothetical protein [Pseudonocardia parietis]MBP2364647.1 hypothetical protein [Pseudonocardia parietis]
MAFPVIDVSRWENVSPEPVGREEKVWLRPLEGTVDTAENDWLFKPVVFTSDGHRQGEDWAEKVVSEVAGLLGMPCAAVELAVRDGTPGSLSRNVVPDGWNLVSGSVLLSAIDPTYVEGRLRPPGRAGHSPSVILRALADIAAPSGLAATDARQVFAGYLLLDAWVGNQDRHDQNWAVLREASAPGGMRLAPSFDHASSLGFQRRDSFRVTTLRNGLEGFVAKARAHRFEHDPVAGRAAIPSLVDVARTTLDAVPEAATWWARLAGIRAQQVETVVAGIPGLSEPTAMFVVEMLRLNRRRLLDVW